MAATAPLEAPKEPAALRTGVRQNRTRNRACRRSNPRTCNCPAHRHSREVWHMTNVKCQHHKRPNKSSAPNNPPLDPRVRAKRNENRFSKPRRNTGKSSNQRRTCPGKKGPWQPQRCVGQIQQVPKGRAEELRYSKSASHWDYARLVSEIEGLMSDDIEANIGPYLNEFIQTMQCIQARAAVTCTPTTLSDAGIAHFAKACSKLASSTLNNGRDMSQISLVTLLNQCQQLLSIHSARPSPPKSTSTPRLTSMPTPPQTQKQPVPILTSTPPIPSPAQEKHIPKIALKLTPTPIPTRSLNSLLPTIEPISTPTHFKPRYPTAPSRSPSPFVPPTQTSTSAPTSTSPHPSSTIKPPIQIHEQELSDGEDGANFLAEQRLKNWTRRRERERRDLEDTIRFPRFRRVRGGVHMGGVEIGTVGNPIVVDEDESDESSDSDSEEEEEEEAEDSNEEMEDEMESMEEMESVENETRELRCRGSSVDLESVLKLLQTSLKWKMQYGIWQNS